MLMVNYKPAAFHDQKLKFSNFPDRRNNEGLVR